MNIPDMVFAFANSRKPRKPSGSRVKLYDDPLTDTKSAVAFLESSGYPHIVGFPDMPASVNDMALTEMRHLREAIEEILGTVATSNQKGCNPSGTLFAGPLGVLNRLASKCPWIKALGPGMDITEIPVQPDPVGLLATKCIRELAYCDLTRIKRCERAECGHFFYDTTRNRSAKWHAENPCGWRARSGRRQKGDNGSH